MSFSYDISLSDLISQVRFNLDDTNPDDYAFEDETIDYLLTANNDDVLEVTLQAAYSLWMKYSKEATKAEVDGVRIEYGQKAQIFEKIYNELKDKAKKSKYKKGVPFYFGGINRQEFNNNRENSNLVKPDFTKGSTEFNSRFPQSTPVDEDDYWRLF